MTVVSKWRSFLRPRVSRGKRRGVGSRRLSLESLEDRRLLSASPTLKFQFEPRGAPVVAGYVGVAATPYSASLGYGWSAGSTVFADQRWAPSVSPLRTGFDYGTNGTFLDDLPDGTYTVSATLGDAADPRYNVALWAQGKLVASGLSTAGGQFTTQTFQVTVTNGQLAIRLADLNGTDPYFAINNLTITPVSSTPATGSDSPGSSSASSGTITSGTDNFQFGTDSMAVVKGFTGVAATTYSSSLGYGWSASSRVYADQRWAAGADPLSLGFNYATDATFLVNVPNGSYNVTPDLGDALVSRSGVSIWAQGTQVASSSSTAAGQFVEPSFTATVSNGQLALRFVPAEGANPYFSITSLKISPVGTPSSSPSSTPQGSSSSSAVSHGNPVLIDASWLASRGPGPYALTQANTTYVLETDVTTPGTAFVAAAPNVLLDLNGHTVTYGDAAQAPVGNGGFETGTGRNVPGWDLSGTRSATIAPNTDGLFGSQVLQLSHFNQAASQTLISAPIPIAEANHTYAASVSVSAAGGTQNQPLADVVIQVYRASDNALLATGSTGGGYNANGSLATFTPTSTSPVYLKITVTAEWGNPTIELDDVSLSPSYDYGVVATGEWGFKGSTNLPSSMQWVGSQGYNNAGAFTLTSSVAGGTIKQGNAAGYGSDGVFAQSLNAPLVINGVTVSVNGNDTTAIDGMNNAKDTTAATETITNNTIVCQPGMDIIQRMNDIGQIDLSRVSGDTVVTGNTITGVPQMGIVITGNPPTQAETAHLIQNNKIVGDTVVTNGYLVSAYGISNLKILDNTLMAGAGQSAEGIDLDSQTTANSTNIEVSGNYVNVREAAQREYGTGIPGRALRIRNDAGGSSAGSFINLSVSDNTFIGEADSTSTLGTIGAWITLVNNPGATAPNSAISFTGNQFEAFSSSTVHGTSATALAIDGIDPGINPTFIGNTLTSNNISLALTDSDATAVSDVTLIGNSLAKSTSSTPLPYSGIVAGYWVDTIQGVNLIDTQAVDGATTAIHWTGSGSKELSTGSSLAVTVTNTQGSPLSGASVAILNANGTQIGSGTTGSDGVLANIAVPSTQYQQLGSNPNQIAQRSLGPFTIVATSGSSSVSKAVAINGDTSVTVQI
jgi:hypothetical protein